MKILISVVSIGMGLAFSYPIVIAFILRIGNAGPFTNIIDLFNHVGFLREIFMMSAFLLAFMIGGIYLIVRQFIGVVILLVASIVYFIGEIWAFQVGHDTFIRGIIPTVVVFIIFVFSCNIALKRSKVKK